jgi:hypothetical protein
MRIGHLLIAIIFAASVSVATAAELEESFRNPPANGEIFAGSDLTTNWFP